MDSYMASNVSCFMFTWIIFKNHFLKVGLNTKLRDYYTLEYDNILFIVCYHEYKLIEIVFG